MDRRPKILAVDDRPENLVALEVILRDLDVELVKAGSGNEALKATLYNDFALVLLDIQMPEMDGYELAGILREEEKTSHIPFIFISAVYTDYLDVFKGYEKGAFSCITKPFQPEILLNKVKFFIEKHQQEVALYNLNEDLKGKNLDLESVNRELEAFTYSVSHDLRAPLRVINGYAEILLKAYEQLFDDRGRSLLGKIGSNARRMSDLVENLLSFSQLDKRQLNRGAVDMNALAKEAIDEVRVAQPESKPRVKLHSLHSIQGDAELLRQVLVNLVANAFKYSGKEADPVVEIGSEMHNSEILYYVKDNGVGFDMKVADRLFGVFQRLHSPAEFEGTGIGLAIVQRIVSHHGGRVWAESEPGKGASFYCALPVE